jgi:hypothetical protein
VKKLSAESDDWGSQLRYPLLAAEVCHEEHHWCIIERIGVPISELKDKHEPPEVTESREIVQQGEQDNEQPGFEEDGPARWSESEALSDLSPKVEGIPPPDAGDNLTFDQYMERVKELDVSTGRDQAVFFSGRDPVFAENPLPDSDKVENYKMANHYAEMTGKTTLEMTPGGRWLNEHDPEKNPNLTKEQAKEVWTSLSQRYAEGASGEVVAFSRLLPDDPIWEKEKELLKQNPNVTKIDEV